MSIPPPLGLLSASAAVSKSIEERLFYILIEKLLSPLFTDLKQR